MKSDVTVTALERQFFLENGYLIKRQLLSSESLSLAINEANALLKKPVEPLELEAAVGYPGAPKTAESEGGRTIRRVLSLCSRSESVKNMATKGPIAGVLQHLFGSKTPAFLNQNHHNCLMTKAPSYSSDTHWHQDIRYWHFKQPNLISAWIALGSETANNGALQVIPKSHSAQFDHDQFDEDKFFIEGLEKNRTWLDNKIQLTLEPGDVLFFDSRLLHKATRNATETVKLSMVFTYHDATNAPIANTRSSNLPEIQLGEG
ncbi:phytanoyl-CoA dioxygenase family protein [Reinekea marina]|uniref:Phytanoyl-CoA dioxygenase family protein n=1 Tax=Reinekea marina TaxID=1310421 RepID=A0ABV7WTJ9_9GAMM